MQQLPHLVFVERPDYRARKAEGDHLLHQAFGGVASFQVDVAVSATSILDRSTFKCCRNNHYCWGGADPLLSVRCVDKLFALPAARNDHKFVLHRPVAVYPALEALHVATNRIDFLGIECACGRRCASAIGRSDALRRPQKLAKLFSG